MKRYKAIFFDWDGTAVLSRSAPVDEVVAPMGQLLEQGVKLCVISGTTYEKIASGKLEEYFPAALRSNLFLGLARGAENYGFDEKGARILLKDVLPSRSALERLHQLCFTLHLQLLHCYGINTDIVFNRPNYCKLDLLCGLNRGEQLYFQANEAQLLEKHLSSHGFSGGLQGLIFSTEQLGEQLNCPVKATSDAKYLEVGLSTKSNNVDFLLNHLQLEACDCCFWGDEFLDIGDGVFGSDAQMLTEYTASGDFFDVSDVSGLRPPRVTQLGGGVHTFLKFLQKQVRMR